MAFQPQPKCTSLINVSVNWDRNPAITLREGWDQSELECTPLALTVSACPKSGCTLLQSIWTPTPAEIERGHEIAAWVIKNAKRLGIMYVIYRQRIWNSRTGHWRLMSNRGGTTANHFDHPHISVY